MIKFPHKPTTREAFENIHQVVLDGISDNMDMLIKYGKYGVTNKTYSTTMGYYVIKFFS